MKKYVIYIPVVFLVLSACVTPRQRANFHSRQGGIYFEEQNYNKARKNLEAAVKNGASGPEEYYMLGATYYHLNMFEEASEKLLEASRKDSGNHRVWFMLGNAYYNLDNYRGAAAAYRRAIEVKPDFLPAVEALAMLHPDGGVTDAEACAMWKKALEIETREEWIIRANHYMKSLGCEGGAE